MYIRIVEGDSYQTDFGIFTGESSILSETVNCVTIQYWFFYIVNDWINFHEGDWELVEIIWKGDNFDEIIDNNQEPEFVVCSQHFWNERWNWQDVKKVTGEETHSIIYVAKGSHANYFTDGITIQEAGLEYPNCQIFTWSDIREYIAMQIYNWVYQIWLDEGYTIESSQNAAFACGYLVKLLLNPGDLISKPFITIPVVGLIINFIIAKITNLLIETLLAEIQIILNTASLMSTGSCVENTQHGHTQDFKYQFITSNDDWLFDENYWGRGWDFSLTEWPHFPSPKGPYYQGEKWHEPGNWGVNEKGISVFPTRFGGDVKAWIFSVFSPVDFHVYDSKGDHAGMNYSTGEVENNIPDTILTNDTHPIVFISTNTSEIYQTKLYGTDTGDYTCQMFYTDTNSSYYTNISGSVNLDDNIEIQTSPYLHDFEIKSDYDTEVEVEFVSESNNAMIQDVVNIEGDSRYEFTVGEWDSFNEDTQVNVEYDIDDDGTIDGEFIINEIPDDSTPGFELIILICALALFLFWKRKKRV